ncbi:VCBS repeat-containing protein [soil metagenome]
MGCKTGTVANDALHFTQMKCSDTNIFFNNKITESDSINVFTNEYMYNGSGVGIGDFNNDGLPDLFFCGSMVSSKLFINKGNFVFEDVTEKAGLQTSRWCTGVNVVDINNDGFADVYVCASHSSNKDKRTNQLFINDGKMHFTDQAEAYGLADTGYATQVAFFDYDKDGDLDMYLLNHRLYSHTANNIELKDTSGNSPAEDRLYRNDGIPPGLNHPVFHDVSAQAGIKEDGYGLGVVITDVNNDNWPDMYVANDYIGNDLLWLNNKNGSFTNVISTALKHESYNSMGVDAADINNDGLPDLAVLDMLPETNERKKMMAASSNQQKYDMQQRFGYHPSFVRNMLQLNNGTREVDNKTTPFYSEIGQQAGIFETDWSWSVLMADFDNDGWKDMHVTNGLGKDVTNNDYKSFNSSEEHGYTFGNVDKGKNVNKKDIPSLKKNLDPYGSVTMDNYLFKNNRNFGFDNITKQAGLSTPSISNGAVYVDLDNDGDLDLVVNNINQEAFVWKNEIRKSASDSVANFLCLQLKGSKNNIAGFGSKVTLFDKGKQQFLEQVPVRGFSSSVDSRLHFGVGDSRLIDSIKIQWPDDKTQTISNIKSNQLLTLRYEDAVVPAFQNKVMNAGTIFTEITDKNGISFKHTESQNFDFGFHQPLPQKFSQLGPCIAEGDINGDGLNDFFVGGAANQSGKFFIQQANGRFNTADLVAGNKPEEDLGAILFDADGDKDLDLIITGGSFEFSIPKYNQPRLYINDGKGNFKLDITALPAITDITKAVTVADYDSDGDLDIFIGGRLSPNKYPQSPRSYLLQNNKGKFSDVTKQVCPLLENAGLLTDAIFTDFNNDHHPDLIICGEYAAVRFFKNENGKLVEVTGQTGLKNMSGLWRCIQQADVDKDGDMDYIVGNLGLNNKYKISAGRPMMLYAKDLDKNGFDELIPAYFIKNKNDQYQLYPALDRNQMSEQVPTINKKYLLHKDFAQVTMNRLLNDFSADGWTALKCETTTSVWIENTGNGKFQQHALPTQAQFAPINSIVTSDIDNDGNIDLIIAGNEYQTESNTGRYDAGYGLVMKGNGKGDFKPCNIVQSGLIIDGDVKALKMIITKNNNKVLVAAPNDSKLRTYFLNPVLKN